MDCTGHRVGRSPAGDYHGNTKDGLHHPHDQDMDMWCGPSNFKGGGTASCVLLRALGVSTWKNPWRGKEYIVKKAMVGLGLVLLAAAALYVHLMIGDSSGYAAARGRTSSTGNALQDSGTGGGGLQHRNPSSADGQEPVSFIRGAVVYSADKLSALSDDSQGSMPPKDMTIKRGRNHTNSSCIHSMDLTPSPSHNISWIRPTPTRSAATLSHPAIKTASAKSTSVNVTAPDKIEHSSKWLLSEVELRAMSSVEAMSKNIKAQPLRTSLHGIELNPQIFYNLSHFLESYELMEKMLRIYIYEEGRGRLVHTGPVLGIYSSEGLFIRQMERGRHPYRARTAEEALAFFMPYSVANMVDDLYEAGSKSMHPLSAFIAAYIDTIAAAHPFWNRTHGADHFFVACHDWGTLVTQEHEELKNNVIKVVCNADNMGGFFHQGKDVSLPEFYMHTEHLDSEFKPMTARAVEEEELGVTADIERRVKLAFFAGRMHGRVRPKLLELWQYPKGGEEMQIYGILDESLRNASIYEEHMRRSKFCICAMGYEVNSPRIVEAIHAGCVPVIIADGFVLPFSEVLDWSTFSVVLPEERLPELKRVLSRITESEYGSMRRRLIHVRRHFIWHHPRPQPFDTFHMILHSLWINHLHTLLPTAT